MDNGKLKLLLELENFTPTKKVMLKVVKMECWNLKRLGRDALL